MSWKITLRDIVSDRELKIMAQSTWKQRVIDIRQGKVITRSYRPSTITKRLRYGLSVAYVDLTGNTAYSRHGWRLLDYWHVKISGSKREPLLVWNSPEAETIYESHVRRYGELL